MSGSPELGAAFLRFLVHGYSSGQGNDAHEWESFDRVALGGCDVHSIQAGEGWMQCRCVVRPTTMNGFLTMHGGCIATLIDVVSSAALVTIWGTPGVSVSMDVQYISPGLADSVLEVRARVLRAGKHIATMTVDIVDTGKNDMIISHGVHVKSYSKSDRPLSLGTTIPTKGKDPKMSSKL